MTDTTVSTLEAAAEAAPPAAAEAAITSSLSTTPAAPAAAAPAAPTAPSGSSASGTPAPPSPPPPLPSIGRIVLHSPAWHPKNDEPKVSAAIVTDVISGTVVDLTVFPAGGVPYPVRGVRMAGDSYREPGDRDSWSWPTRS